MTTDKQRAIAAIESLNKARNLLESSTDQAQHDIAEEVGAILTQLENLEFFGRRLALAYSFCRDVDSGKWLATEEFVSGYTVIAEFATKNEAQEYVESLRNGGQR